jgi:hypothetical protein
VIELGLFDVNPVIRVELQALFVNHVGGRDVRQKVSAAKDTVKKQVGAPTVPSVVLTRSFEFEDFRCHRRVKVLKCVTSILMLNWQIFVIFSIF